MNQKPVAEIQDRHAANLPVITGFGSHDRCQLSNVFYLITGEQIGFPWWVGPGRPRTRAESLVRLGMSVGNVLWNGHGSAIALSGPGIKYHIGDIAYFSEDILRQSLQFIASKQPVFVVPGRVPDSNTAEVCGCDKTPRPYLHLTGHCLVLVFANWRGSPAVFQFGQCDRAIAEIRRKVEGLRIGATDPRVSSLVPRTLAFFSAKSGGAVVAEEKKPGACPQFSWNLIDAILELWCGKGAGTELRARPSLNQDLDRIAKSLPTYSSLLERAGEKLMKWHSDCHFPSEVSHGDLWLSNVLFEGQRISAIIDWEWARADGHRIVDAIHLLLMSYSDFRNVHVAELLRQVWTDSIEDGELSVRLNALQSRFGVARDDMMFLTLLLWFDYLEHDTIRWGIPWRGWHQKLIPALAPAIQSFLARHVV